MEIRAMHRDNSHSYHYGQHLKSSKMQLESILLPMLERPSQRRVEGKHIGVLIVRYVITSLEKLLYLVSKDLGFYNLLDRSILLGLKHYIHDLDRLEKENR